MRLLFVQLVDILFIFILQLEFWGVVGIGFYSDIALDDILVVPGTCDGKLIVFSFIDNNTFIH